MRNLMMVAALGVMIAGGLEPISAKAQTDEAPPQQTLENAKRFATMTMTGTRVYMSGSPRPVRLEQVVDVDRCVLRLTARGDAMTVGQTEWSAVYNDNWRFDFSNIIDIQPLDNSTRIRIQFRGETVHWILDAGSAALQARLSYAMEFIREACDATAATGF